MAWWHSIEIHGFQWDGSGLVQDEENAVGGKHGFDMCHHVLILHVHVVASRQWGMDFASQKAFATIHC
jgi:hypothetical protein